jgi:hypothetical protein
MNFKDLKLIPIPVDVAYQLVSNYHYSRVMPKLTHVCYGGEINGELVAVITLGWGVRPLHTIKKLFPALMPQDYWEIGKMCLVDDLPRNSESYFMSMVIKEVKKTHPEKKIIYTWADGIVGKPGYVYQAANFHYGGFIWTDTYISELGEKIHPRTSQSIVKKNGNYKKQSRPTLAQLNEQGITHYQGKQFRYAYFLKDEKQLMNQSTVKWTIKDYPKDKDLEWKKKTKDGYWVLTDKPFLSNNYSYNKVRPVSDAIQDILL